ncbi:undecaprenyldiphospho-muramoylpentapeptide beta-N-acetylglucosaminyltransferase [Bacillus sp. 1P06AnD]|uniref:undecaprenyldiphospho-muramoylpentapeptide beta-N-acetylglucosaminyltransferase n=1 Tax=Bacillus sp. 1P06AnD TaxID=3132208 RepID=UPI0039A37009
MKIVISGGGTGGHIYPALALIREIQKKHQNCSFLYIGTEKGLESQLVPRENIPFKSIHITGFKRKISFENVKTVFRFLKGVSDSKKILKEFKADVVIGTGGYVCGPVVYAAAKLGIPTIIHEQNSVPGLTNKFLSRYCSKVAVCFEEAAAFFPAEKTVLTGNPRASEVVSYRGKAGLKELGLDIGKPTVLVVGGSRGARPINEAVLKVMAELGEKPYQLLYVTGDVHYEKVMDEMKLIGNPSNVVVKPFIHNMPAVLAGVDLVVARSGATTLAELTALGVPSILVPSPYVTNNHQEKNANALVKNGAAVMVLEKDLTGSKLVSAMDELLLSKDELEKMKDASKSLGMPEASEHVYKLMKEVSNQR